MTAAGYFLLGLAAGVILGALAAYGGLVAWAIRDGEENDDEG